MIGSVIERATVVDVLRLGGFGEPDRHGFLVCPLHSERSGSFHVIGNGKGFRCFGCGAKGGVLDLAVALGVVADRAAAARWLEAVLR